MFSAVNGDRSNVQNVVVIITDGAANIDRQLTVPYAVSARNNGVYITCLGVGSLLDMIMLNSMASPPIGSSVFTVSSGSQLANMRDTIYMTTCNGTWHACIARNNSAIYSLI